MKTSSNTIPARGDVYERVTNKIIADLEAGIRTWLKPWSGENIAAGIPLRHCGTPYRGINILLLWGEAMTKGYSASTWMTYRQAMELGGHVRKGEQGSLVVYANTITRTEEGADGAEIEHQIPFMKGYTVFNVEQIDGLPETYVQKPEALGEPMQLIEAAESFFTETGATFHHGGNRAFYSPATDTIRLPYPESFADAESYAATKAHELVHWTKHQSRLDRDFGRKQWGDEGYAREELVAELGAAFLCAALGITPEVRADHADYIGNWLEVLKHDKRAIFTAASHAQRAVDYLYGLQSAQETIAA